MLMPHSIIHGDAYFAYFNKIWGIPFRSLVMNQPGLDNCHRDKEGELSRKYGNTLIGTLRKAYGSFAPHCAKSDRLSDVLHKLDEASLRQLIRDYEAGKLEQICRSPDSGKDARTTNYSDQPMMPHV